MTLSAQALLSFAVLAWSAVASAQNVLPYSQRTLSFSGLSTTVRGDIRTVGMGGASAGLADTFIASIDNPAGLAMTVGVGDIHYASSSFQDAHIQRYSDSLTAQSVGLALGLYPWAVSAGYLSPYREGDTYEAQSQLLHAPTLHLGLITRELVVSAARVFFHNRLSVGVGVTGAQAERTLYGPKELGGDRAWTSYTGGATGGAMVQLPKRILLGVSFSSPLHFSGASEGVQQKLLVPGFFQPVDTPWRATFGAAFVANRYFRADLTLHVYTTTPHTALIRDEAALVGQHVTLDPHLGFAYVFADYREVKGTFYLGSYFEDTRIAGTTSRFHGTAGFEARLWVITVGAGIDGARGYDSYTLSVSADVFNWLARLGVIPPFGTPPARKLFPSPFALDDTGLARPLVEHYTAAGDLDPIKVGLAIPGNLKKGAIEVAKDVKEVTIGLTEKLVEATESQKKKDEKAAEDARVAAALKAEEERMAAALEAEKELEQKELAAKAAAAKRRRHKRRHVIPAEGSSPTP